MNILIIVQSICFSQILIFPQDKTNGLIDTLKNLEPFEGIPGLIGGYDLLQMKISYPEDAIKNNIGGNVIVKVTIDTSGNPIRCELEKGIGYGCDKEVINAIKNSKFIPPSENGKRIESFCYINIVFKLPDGNR